MNTTSVKNSIRIYQRSGVIFQNNSIGKEMYIIRSGKVRLLLGAARGEAEVGILEKPGEFFGEMALIDGSPRSATAIADEDNTELEVVDREKFLEMIRQDPEFALDLMKELKATRASRDTLTEGQGLTYADLYAALQARLGEDGAGDGRGNSEIETGERDCPRCGFSTKHRIEADGRHHCLNCGHITEAEKTSADDKEDEAATMMNANVG